MIHQSVVPNLLFDKSSVTRGNKFKLIEDIDRFSHDIRKYYFTVRITPIWNILNNLGGGCRQYKYIRSTSG